MALLVIASHLHQILGVDEEKRRELKRINRMKNGSWSSSFKGAEKCCNFVNSPKRIKLRLTFDNEHMFGIIQMKHQSNRVGFFSL